MRFAPLSSSSLSAMARWSSAIRLAHRDKDAADELSQEFALRFVRGDLKGADRERGWFRDFLKGCCFT